jgi:hypothetical protein
LAVSLGVSGCHNAYVTARQGNDALVIGGLVLFTAACGWLLAFVVVRLLRRQNVC